MSSEGCNNPLPLHPLLHPQLSFKKKKILITPNLGCLDCLPWNPGRISNKIKSRTLSTFIIQLVMFVYNKLQQNYLPRKKNRIRRQGFLSFLFACNIGSSRVADNEEIFFADLDRFHSSWLAVQRREPDRVKSSFQLTFSFLIFSPIDQLFVTIFMQRRHCWVNLQTFDIYEVKRSILMLNIDFSA